MYTVAHVEYSTDVRMIQGGGRARLSLETLPGAAAGNRFRKDRDRHLPAQARVVRAIHFHPSQWGKGIS